MSFVQSAQKFEITPAGSDTYNVIHNLNTLTPVVLLYHTPSGVPFDGTEIDTITINSANEVEILLPGVAQARIVVLAFY